MSSYIVAAIGEWNKITFDELSKSMIGKWYFSDTPEDLAKLLENIEPRYIFFPHWRWIVPSEILNKYECICFHMTDVPFGRGGSPLQNLIIKGHKDTVLTALRMVDKLDAGPVYLKKELNLKGSAEEIYQRASLLTWKMIQEFLEHELIPMHQVGDPVYFKRRRPEESLIPDYLELEQVYDYIRMLDAPGYPKAFLKFGDYRLEFEKAELNSNEVTAKVIFTKN